MQNHKIKSYIGFAVKARDVIYGLDNILEAKRHIEVIVKDSSLEARSQRKLSNYLEKNPVDVVTLEDISLGKDILKRDNCKIIGILNSSLADAIKNEASSK